VKYGARLRLFEAGHRLDKLVLFQIRPRLRFGNHRIACKHGWRTTSKSKKVPSSHHAFSPVDNFNIGCLIS
jgi:hypothetical protein